MLYIPYHGYTIVQFEEISTATTTMYILVD